MGTRGAFGFRKGGTDKIKYNQFDSYPGGMGQAFFEACKKAGETLDQAEANLLDCSAEIPSPEPDWATDSGERFFSEETRESLRNKFGENKSDVELVRSIFEFADRSMEMATLVDPKNKVPFFAYNGFMADSLFCEYAYMANLDEEVFEVYSGFRKDPGPGRYGNLKDKGDKYFGVALAAAFPLREFLGLDPQAAMEAMTIVLGEGLRSQEDEQDAGDDGFPIWTEAGEEQREKMLELAGERFPSGATWIKSLQEREWMRDDIPSSVCSSRRSSSL